MLLCPVLALGARHDAAKKCRLVQHRGRLRASLVPLIARAVPLRACQQQSRPLFNAPSATSSYGHPSSRTNRQQTRRRWRVDRGARLPSHRRRSGFYAAVPPDFEDGACSRGDGGTNGCLSASYSYKDLGTRQHALARGLRTMQPCPRLEALNIAAVWPQPPGCMREFSCVAAFRA